MRKYIAFFSSFFIFATCLISFIVAMMNGCGPGKELPDEVTIHKDAIIVPSDPGGEIPKVSDTAAKDVYNRAIKAITEGKLETQARALNCRVTAHGKYKFPNYNEMVETVRTVTTIWPDRASTTYEFKEGFLGKRTVGLRGTFGWMHPELPLYYPPSEVAKVIAIDVTAQQWIPLSLDLTQRDAVFFAAKQNGPEGTTSFKFGWPERTDWPVYNIVCDDKTGLPVKIDYSPLSIDRQMRYRFVLTLADHKSFLGMMLPTSMKLKANDTLVEDWTIDTWEFPETIDNAIFEKPKENEKPKDNPKDNPTKK
jgi:hypothetical protein